MKRIGLLLTLLLLFLAACGSGGAEVAEQAEIEEPTAQATTLSASNESTEGATVEPEPTNEIATPLDALDGDPTLARDRDWKQGNLADPTVTIIEYGDFQ
jgi:hypothetical protein